MWRQIHSSFFMLSAAKISMLSSHLDGYLPCTTAFSENMLCCGPFFTDFKAEYLSKSACSTTFIYSYDYKFIN